jgi:hypothetical protein
MASSPAVAASAQIAELEQDDLNQMQWTLVMVNGQIWQLVAAGRSAITQWPLAIDH